MATMVLLQISLAVVPQVFLFADTSYLSLSLLITPQILPEPRSHTDSHCRPLWLPKYKTPA